MKAKPSSPALPASRCFWTAIWAVMIMIRIKTPGRLGSVRAMRVLAHAGLLWRFPEACPNTASPDMGGFNFSRHQCRHLYIPFLPRPAYPHQPESRRPVPWRTAPLLPCRTTPNHAEPVLPRRTTPGRTTPCRAIPNHSCHAAPRLTQPGRSSPRHTRPFLPRRTASHQGLPSPAPTYHTSPATPRQGMPNPAGPKLTAPFLPRPT